MRSLMQKISCSSWENIRVFVEKAGAAKELREYFHELNDPKTAKFLSLSFIQKQVASAINTIHLPGIKSLRSLSSVLHKYQFFHQTFIIFGVFCVVLSAIIYTSTLEIQPQSELRLPPNDQLLVRRGLQEKIVMILNKSRALGREVPCVTIIGIGGAGKTTLARMIARGHQGVVWEINAETIDSLKSSYISLAYTLAQNKESREKINFIMNMPAGKVRDDNLIRYIKEQLKLRKDGWCLLLDNVESLKHMEDYIPQNPKIWGRGCVLITTRNQNCRIGRAVPINDLSQTEKLELFQKVTTINTISNNTEDFLAQLPPYPLDIVVAGKYVQRTKTNIFEYLERLRFSQLGEEEQRFLVGHELSYTKTRYEIVHSSLKEILHQLPDAKRTLLALSLMDSQSIPTLVLEALCKDCSWKQLLSLLKSYSLITSESTINSIEVISLHRSIQRIIANYLQDYLKKEDYENNLLEVSHAIEGFLNKALFELERYDLAIATENHLKVLLQRVDKTSPSWRRIALQYLNLSATLVQTSRLSFQEFKQLAEFTMSKINMKKTSSQQSNQFYLFKSLYGEVLYLQGEYSYALDQTEAAYKYFKQLDPKSLGYYKSSHRLANLYRVLGRYEYALMHLKESFKLSLIHSKQWVEHSNLLIQKSLYLRDLGHYQESQKVLINSKDTLRLHRSSCLVFTPYDHYSAALDSELGYYDVAINKGYQLEKGVFALDKRYPGFVYIYLGRALFLKGKFKSADEVLHKAKHLCEKYQYDHNINYIRSLLPTLGQLYTVKKQYDKAKEILLRASSLIANHYGEKHFMIARVKAYTGELALARGHLDEAEHCLQESLALLKPINHTDMYIPLEILAKLYHTRYIKGQAQKQLSTKAIQKMRKLRNQYLLEAYNLIKARFPKESEHVTRITRKMEKYRIKQEVEMLSKKQDKNI